MLLLQDTTRMERITQDLYDQAATFSNSYGESASFQETLGTAHHWPMARSSGQPVFFTDFPLTSWCVYLSWLKCLAQSFHIKTNDVNYPEPE